MLENKVRRHLKSIFPDIKFSNEDLAEYIAMALNDFNSHAPETNWSLKDLVTKKRMYITTILIKAVAFGCFAVSCDEVIKEFREGKIPNTKNKAIKYRNVWAKDYEKLVRRKKDYCVLILK